MKSPDWIDDLASRRAFRWFEGAVWFKKAAMTRSGFYARLAISVVIDLMDFTVGRIPILGTAEDGIGGIVLTALWGRAGLAYFWELFDITDQIDGFIPTATLIGLYVGWREGHLFGGRGRDMRRVEEPPTIP